MKRHSLSRLLGAAAGAAGATYGCYVCASWLHYGKHRPAKSGEADPMLDRFMPIYEVVERHAIQLPVPAELALATATDVDLDDSAIVRGIIKGREFLLRAPPQTKQLPRGLLAKTKAMGWGLLAESEGREIVMGAVTQPWEADAKFHALAPDAFLGFNGPGYVKIAWTLRADPVTSQSSIFRTETRAVACSPDARKKFRKYWAFLSPGIILIRRALLHTLRREALRRIEA